MILRYGQCKGFAPMILRYGQCKGFAPMILRYGQVQRLCSHDTAICSGAKALLASTFPGCSMCGNPSLVNCTCQQQYWETVNRFLLEINKVYKVYYMLCTGCIQFMAGIYHRLWFSAVANQNWTFFWSNWEFFLLICTGPTIVNIYCSSEKGSAVGGDRISRQSLKLSTLITICTLFTK